MKIQRKSFCFYFYYLYACPKRYNSNKILNKRMLVNFEIIVRN